MDHDDVPQDNSPTYEGHRRLLYATDRNGEYVGVQSSGWEAETIMTNAAIDEIDRLSQSAWERVQRGETAALEYYMCYRRMDLALLSQTTGFWQWRIRRHFKPAIYAQLGDRVLARYSEALGIGIPVLKTLVAKP